MKVFAINETEWIAAETQEEALEFEGYEDVSEVDSIEEIPESEWDDEVEALDLNDEGGVIKTTIRKMIETATKFPYKVMTECY